MNNYQYEELVKHVQSVPKFKQMVALESKRKTAVKLLEYVAHVDSNTAWDFVNEYYDRMDINIFQER